MTLIANLPDKIDASHARWSLAYSLYNDGSLTLEEAASVSGVAPTYFKRRLEDISAGRFQLVQTKNSLANSFFNKGNHLLDKPFERERFDELVEQLDIQESYEELLTLLTK
ncbi:MAG: hypothetical protein EAZ91_25375 [Cytophagales bacterium]|nr:MAG: hypothetical protein EAZ91_25375 [Cytophagales bacterium]